MNILLIGDIVGSPGRDAVRDLLPGIKEKKDIDFVIANAENSAGGNGITVKIAHELFNYGIDVITSGDHIWKNKDIINLLEVNNRVLRPANYPEGSPGNGYSTYTTSDGHTIGVINLMGRVFMQAIDCPFKKISSILEELRKKTSLILVDFHAEATSEKVAMGWHLDGMVTGIVGTHTHIPTRDARILTDGTAYITDLGMVGSIDSVIGVDKEAVIKRFLTQMPTRFQPAKENVHLQGVIITADPKTGKASNIEMVEYSV